MDFSTKLRNEVVGFRPQLPQRSQQVGGGFGWGLEPQEDKRHPTNPTTPPIKAPAPSPIGPSGAPIDPPSTAPVKIALPKSFRGVPTRLEEAINDDLSGISSPEGSG